MMLAIPLSPSIANRLALKDRRRGDREGCQDTEGNSSVGDSAESCAGENAQVEEEEVGL